MSDAIELMILAALQKTSSPITARDLCLLLPDANRATVNAALYALLDAHRVDQHPGFPPQWSENLSASVVMGSCPAKSLPEHQLIVMVDLRHVQDCCDALLEYKNQPDILIWAFADMQYNGTWMNPPAPPPVSVFQADTSDSTATDVMMIWKIAELIFSSQQEPTKLFHFVLCTKSQGFRSIQNAVEMCHHKLDFCSGWNELKLLVE